MLGVAGEYVRDRLRVRTELIPTGFSWTFVLLVDSALILIAVASTAQRATRADLPAALIAAVIAVAPLVLFFAVAIKFSPGLTWVTSYTAVIIWLFAASPPVKSDFAPMLLSLMLGVVGALAPVVYGLLALGSAVALLAVASAAHRLDELALYLSCIAMGWLVGALMRIQAQLMSKQQEMQADLARHAAADERRRIAREVHDVIAHSLSVTLLHVTGARHALQQDRDVDDAVGALTDAERLGRQAMADIRRTVGLLDAEQSNGSPLAMAPEPDISDISDLINDFVQAGLPVTLRTDGEPGQVSPAVGLALYRITQESLANIAKHAPASKAQVDLAISPSVVVLSVVNDLPVRVPDAPAARDGRGLPGMRQRVELLGGLLDAGRCPQGWSVRAEIPLCEPSPRTSRCQR
ncbi:MAG TPA: histidine kinase [Mycobacterium sp.]|nr:histidine kinase [Mycobacterium sp.]